jgi:23S rRNA (guanine1835-N2)-methyltransferase
MLKACPSLKTDPPDQLMASATGNWLLRRYPAAAHPSLRAWDAADERLIDAALPLLQPSSAALVWVLNDNFGAITTALQAWQPWLISDSWISHDACQRNLAANSLACNPARLCSVLALPDGQPDLVLIKIPKSLALLEHQLRSLKPALRPGTQVIAGAMVKHLQPAATTLLDTYIGPSQASLAVKKARLLQATSDQQAITDPSPFPSCYQLAEHNLSLLNHASVFCREHLDIGTRLLLEHLSGIPQAESIIDLGCGNGIVGLLAARQQPAANLTFIDESYMAVASAEANFRASFGATRQASFVTGNCLDGVAAASADLILNNPPFHQQHVVGDHIARQMHRQAFAVLRPGGELWVVGNRQLGYHRTLKDLFGHCQTIASNPKFVVLRAIKH